MEPKKVCLHCNKTIVGRTDKKYCSDNCSATHHYNKIVEANKFRKSVHEILGRNRDILARLNPEGKCTMPRSILESKNFNFNYFTNIYRTKGGNVYWFCYDYGFRKLPKNNLCILVKWQSYMKQV